MSLPWTQLPLQIALLRFVLDYSVVCLTNADRSVVGSRVSRAVNSLNTLLYKEFRSFDAEIEDV